MIPPMLNFPVFLEYFVHPSITALIKIQQLLVNMSILSHFPHQHTHTLSHTYAHIHTNTFICVFSTSKCLTFNYKSEHFWGYSFTLKTHLLKDFLLNVRVEGKRYNVYKENLTPGSILNIYSSKTKIIN